MTQIDAPEAPAPDAPFPINTSVLNGTLCLHNRALKKKQRQTSKIILNA